MCCSYVRWSINFFLFRSSEMPPITLTDDEHEIAVVVPKKRRQHCGALGSAVVSHFSYCEFLHLETWRPHAAPYHWIYAMAAAEEHVGLLPCETAALQGCGPCCGVLLFSVYEDWATVQLSRLCLCILWLSGLMDLPCCPSLGAVSFLAAALRNCGLCGLRALRRWLDSCAERHVAVSQRERCRV